MQLLFTGTSTLMQRKRQRTSKRILSLVFPSTSITIERGVSVKEILRPNYFQYSTSLRRHGHTTYLDGHLRTKSGNHPFDVILSPLGFQQAAALKDKISGLGAEVILTSPLTRALQTLLNAVDFTQARRVEVCHLHTEHVSNSGDVGRPSSMLSREFPMLSFTGLEEVWWFSPKDAPNDPVMGVFRSRESMEHLRKRVGLFRQYLLSRPENIIIVIGHSTFFKELSGRRKRMENCEMLTVKL
ncbi:hypothetical protein KP509_19G049400 [Ceratopteris richardii]|uniref:Uncharacterized protein n=1 Tax=Ceratopteris richardii TaxID=49495 RepID=A0A8T2SLZ0_CERRI|nr:hypothetical protein KP509_19G049400 [Ceratopteris richardii]